MHCFAKNFVSKNSTGGFTWRRPATLVSTLMTFVVLLTCATLPQLVFAAPPDGADRAWPYYVPVAPPVPDAELDGWSRNEIDAFVLAKLQEQGLSPSPLASPERLVRRLYFDLLGLPPAPAQVASYLADPGPGAYAKLVERLLDDPRYGERWGRYWLDLARYADTAGYEGDPDLPHAWRYRDYVIDSLNKDKPFDQFIREQIAGDELREIMGAGELPLPSAEQTVAMTFLRLAPFTEPRGDETRHEMLSEITSTVGSVFLGLTVGCAKCHDHKHDEIPTADFYRMKAFFSTVQIPPPERGDGFQLGGSLPAKFYREGEEAWAQQQRAAYRQEAASAADELAKLEKRLNERLGRRSGGFAFQSISAAGNDYLYEIRDIDDGALHLSIVNVGEQWQIITDGDQAATKRLSGANRGAFLDDLKQPTHITLGQHTAGSGQPKGAGHRGDVGDVFIYDHPLDETEQRALANYARLKYAVGQTPGTGTKAAATDTSIQPPQHGLVFWLAASDIDGDEETTNPATGEKLTVWVDRVAGLKLSASKEERRPQLAVAPVTGAPVVRFAGSFLKAALDETHTWRNLSQGAIAMVYSATTRDEAYGLEVGGDGKFVSTVIFPDAHESRISHQLMSDPRVTREEKRRYEYLASRKKFLGQHLKRLEPAAMSLRHSFGPPYEPGVPTSRVMIRGEYDNPGEVVEAGFLSCITGNQEAAPIRLDPFKRWPTRSRRLALANWIASRDNPMTARVIVNRLWHWHFGQGIVRTPSDFGHLSGGPSHQELLDWLAVKFVEDGWSLKAMHRLIVKSAAYQQASDMQNHLALTRDPDNRLLWRFNRRRLDAEAIRDSVLAVSGRLSPEMFGLPIFPPLPANIAERVKFSESKWDTQYGARGRKRSIYIYQQRTLTMPFMQTFDALVCDESRPRRRASTTPLQALAMYNGEFVNEEATHFAARVLRDAKDNRQQQIRLAFQLALARDPDADELALLQRMMLASDETTDAESLASLCRVLFNSSEFIFVD